MPAYVVSNQNKIQYKGRKIMDIYNSNRNKRIQI